MFKQICKQKRRESYNKFLLLCIYQSPIFHAEKGDNLLTKNCFTRKKNLQKLHTNVLCVRKIISKQNIVLGKFSSIISKLNIILIFNSLAHGLETHWYLRINVLTTTSTIIFTKLT